MSLKNLPDTQLLVELKNRRSKEREIQAEILEYLFEVRSRELHLARGYSSFFTFLEEELGYCKSMAYHWNQTVRLHSEVKSIGKAIQNGALSVTTAGTLQTFFDREKTSGKRVYTRTEKAALLRECEGKSKSDVEKRLFELSPESARSNQKLQRRTQEETRIEFLADEDFMELYKRVREVGAHSIPMGGVKETFEYLMKAYLSRKDPSQKTHLKRSSKRFQAGFSKNLRSVTASKRAIPVSVRREVFQRDRHQCVYMDKLTGKRCGSKFKLEIDHKVPFSKAPNHSAENLQVLCRRHNQWKADKDHPG